MDGKVLITGPETYVGDKLLNYLPKELLAGDSEDVHTHIHLTTDMWYGSYSNGLPNLKRLICLSSHAISSNDKRALFFANLEKEVRSCGVPYIIVRGFDFIGDNDCFIKHACQKIVAQEYIDLKSGYHNYDGTLMRDYVDPRDIASFFQKVIDLPSEYDGEVLNLGTGVGFSEQNILDYLNTMGTVRFNRVPPQGETPTSIAYMHDTMKVLGWKPQYTIHEAIQVEMEKAWAKNVSFTGAAG